MHCKSLWIKASVKCINVNVNVSHCDNTQKSVNEGVYIWFIWSRNEVKDTFSLGSLSVHTVIFNNKPKDTKQKA